MREEKPTGGLRGPPACPAIHQPSRVWSPFHMVGLGVSDLIIQPVTVKHNKTKLWIEIFINGQTKLDMRTEEISTT